MNIDVRCAAHFHIAKTLFLGLTVSLLSIQEFVVRSMGGIIIQTDYPLK